MPRMCGGFAPSGSEPGDGDGPVRAELLDCGAGCERRHTANNPPTRTAPIIKKGRARFMRRTLFGRADLLDVVVHGPIQMAVDVDLDAVAAFWPIR